MDTLFHFLSKPFTKNSSSHHPPISKKYEEKQSSAMYRLETLSNSPSIETFQNAMMSADAGSGKKLKVGLILAEPYIVQDIVEVEGQKIITYSGMLYEIWEKIKLISGLTVEEYPMSLNYGENILALQQGKVDILIGNIWIFQEREIAVDFTNPIFLSKFVIGYKPQKSVVRQYVDIIRTYYLKHIILIILLGIILGYLLYYVEPERGRRRAIFTSISSLFGEAGFLFENSRLRYSGMILAFGIMIIGFYYNIFLQASATSDVIKEQSRLEINAENLGQKYFIMSKANDVGEILKKFNVRYDVASIPPSEIAQYYLQHTDKYDGYISDYEQIKRDIIRFDELVMSGDIFGYEENAFAVRNGDWELAQKVNVAISTLQNNDTIKTICEKYVDKNDANLCVL